MKKRIKVFFLILLIVALAIGCKLFMGADGKAYIKLTFDTSTSYGNSVDGALISGGGFPSPVTTNVDYEVDPGSYTLDYVLYDNNWYDYSGDGWSDYNTSFNDSVATDVWTDYWVTSDWDDNITYYQNYLFSSRANSFSYSITIEKGQLFMDGEDKYFSVYLDWVTAATSISSRTVPASGMKIIEDSAELVVKELTDGPYTLRLEIKKVPTPTTKDIIMAH